MFRQSRLGWWMISTVVVFTVGCGGRGGGQTDSQPTDPPWPPDPAALAPALDPSGVTPLCEAVAFLHTGDNPVQRGTQAGALACERTAVLRGRVLDEDGAPLEGARVDVLERPEFGYTESRADGRYDLVVNGGEQLVVRLRHPDRIDAQRRLWVPWRDYLAVPEVRMVPRDSQVTVVDLAAGAQMAVASEVSDDHGVRRAAVFTPTGTRAELVMPDGRREPLSTMSLRATELTVGEGGPERMSARLPATSAYTYALDFSLDEAVAAGAEGVAFERPVWFYTDNFLGFPVGTPVPMGSYDPARGVWVPEASGRVIGIVAVEDGLARLDVDGDGQADGGEALAEIGLTEDEQALLADRYEPGASLWRVGVTHFSTWDANWNSGPPDDAEAPGKAPEAEDPDGGCQQDGSVIECNSQVLGEDIGLAGLPFGLHYRSDRVPGRRADYDLDIPLRGLNAPASLEAIELSIDVAGRHEEHSFGPDPEPDRFNDFHHFHWNGLDAYGRTVQGKAKVEVGIGYTYKAVYNQTERFGDWGGMEITGDRARSKVTLWTRWQGALGAFDARGLGLGGWSLGVLHVYDPVGRVLYRGDGGRRDAVSQSHIIETFAGGQHTWEDEMEGGPAVGAGVGYTGDMAVGPNGALYIATGPHVLEVRDDRVHRFAGDARGVDSDDIQATGATLDRSVGVATFGSLVYVSEDVACRVRMIDKRGVIHTVAGTGRCGFSGDGGPATEAKLDRPAGIAVDAEGNLYIADKGNCRIRRVGTDGLIHTVLGDGTCRNPADGTPAAQARVDHPEDLEVGPDGSLYFLGDGHQVFAVRPDGTVRVVAGVEGGGDDGDGGPATQAGIGFPSAIEVDAQGRLFIFQGEGNRVRVVQPDGTIWPLAGGGQGFAERAPAQSVGFSEAKDLAVGQAGELYISNANDSAVRRVDSPFRGFARIDELVVPSADGREVFVFDGRGRHLRTLDALTGITRWSFERDEAGRIASVTDRDGKVTTIVRDAGGRPTGIVSPWGVQTRLQLGAGGYLAGITDPSGAEHTFSYGPQGLLASMTDPNGGTYRFSYDAKGRLLEDEDPGGGYKTLVREDLEDAAGQTVEVTTAEGRQTVYLRKLGAMGARKLTTTFPNGRQTRSSVGADGENRVRYSDGTDVTVRPAPDPRYGMAAPYAALESVTTPAGRQRVIERTRRVVPEHFDSVFDVQMIEENTSVNGATWHRSVGFTRDTIRLTSPEGREVVGYFDSAGRVIKQRMSGLAAVDYVYDDRGRLVDVVVGEGPEARITSLTYDPDGFIATITDPLGRVVKFERDPAGRVIGQTLADGRRIDLAYDPNGNLTAVGPPDRPEHGLGYSVTDELARYDPPSLPSGGGQTRWEHDLDGQTTRVVRPDGRNVIFGRGADGVLRTVTYSQGVTQLDYDNRQQLATILTPDGIELSYDWDGPLLTEERWRGPITGWVTHDWDDDLRLSGLSVSGRKAIPFGYDLDGLLTSAGELELTRDPEHGLVVGTRLESVFTDIGYSAFGEPMDMVARAGNDAFYEVTYERDAAGRIAAKTETVAGITSRYTYHYDLAGRLERVERDGLVTEAYTYDGNSNRLTAIDDQGASIEAAYDDQDRLLAYGDATYTYSDAGDLQSKTDPTGVTSYHYDELTNLRSVFLPDGTSIDYLVDGRNRRIGKRVNGGLVQGFLYKDQLEPIAELDREGRLLSQFIYAEHAHVPSYMIRAGILYRIITDQVGSVRLVVTASHGEVVQQMDYDVFGRVLLDTNPGFQPFGFAGGLWDVDAGLVRFGARDYDAGTGKWLSKDAILFRGGDTNLSRYVSSDPVNHIDPSGFDMAGSYGWSWATADFPMSSKQKSATLALQLAALGLSTAGCFVDPTHISCGGAAAGWLAFFLDDDEPASECKSAKAGDGDEGTFDDGFLMGRMVGDSESIPLAPITIAPNR